MHCLSALHFDNSLLSAWSAKFNVAQPPFWNGFCLAELRLQSSLPERIPRTVSNLQNSGQFSLWRLIVTSIFTTIFVEKIKLKFCKSETRGKYMNVPVMHVPVIVNFIHFENKYNVRYLVRLLSSSYWYFAG